MKLISFCLLLLLGTTLTYGKSFSGYTEPYKTIEASFSEFGTITNIFVEEGDTVKEGDTLATLNNRALGADLKIAEENISLSQRRFDKIIPLVKNGHATSDELDRARSDLAINKLQAERIRAQIDRRIIISPINGVITDVFKDFSEGVSGVETQVLTIVQTNKLIVNLFVDFADANKFHLSNMVPVHFSENTPPAQAKVIFISPNTDKASGTIRVKLLIDNPTGQYSSGILGTVRLDQL